MRINRGGKSQPEILNFNGYTIVEVMIFLAVSSMILVSAIGMLSGQQSKTQFNQSVRDFNSKLQVTIGDVKTGFYPTRDNIRCTLTGVGSNERATLSTGTSQQGTNEDCLYLGKAIQVVNDSSKIYIYTVLGNRTESVGGSSKRTPVTSFDSTNPELALSSSGTIDLTEEYTLPADAKIISSRVYDTSNVPHPDHYLVGFYSSLQETSTATTSDGSQSILSKGYNYNNSADREAVRPCINEAASCSNITIKRWEICVQGGSNQTALITISSTVAGISSDLEYKDCS